MIRLSAISRSLAALVLLFGCVSGSSIPRADLSDLSRSRIAGTYQSGLSFAEQFRYSPTRAIERAFGLGPSSSGLSYAEQWKYQPTATFESTLKSAASLSMMAVPLSAPARAVSFGLRAELAFGGRALGSAAKNTTSLLPARSPWPGNSGFIEGTVERKFLMPGEVVDRYGFGGGRFVSPAGTSVEARALRPGTENLPFNTYRVVKPFEVNAGGVQPWFGQRGLGTQYELPVSVNVLLKRRIIEPVP